MIGMIGCCLVFCAYSRLNFPRKSVLRFKFAMVQPLLAPLFVLAGHTAALPPAQSPWNKMSLGRRMAHYI